MLDTFSLQRGAVVSEGKKWICRELDYILKGKKKKKEDFCWISGSPASACFLADFVLVFLRYIPIYSYIPIHNYLWNISLC